MNKGIWTAILLGVAFAAWADCPPEKADLVQLGTQSWRVEVANTQAARERGLSGRDRLDRGRGMLFSFDPPGYVGFWMKDMRFPLDLIWIGPEGRVLGVSTLSPCTSEPCSIAYPPAPATQVLEVNPGEFTGAAGARFSWRCGDGGTR